MRSRKLARELAACRKKAGLGQDAIAAHLHHNKIWVSHMETPAWCRPKVGDVRSWLARCGITDPAEVERIVRLAIEVRQPGWWQEYDLSVQHATFVALEAEAAAELVWEPYLIPGLLQLTAYARVIIAADGALPPGDVESLVRVREGRQKALVREAEPGPLVLHAVIDETVLLRRLVPPALMRDQLGYILAAMREPNVTVQVLPLDAPARRAMTGPYVILRYAEEDEHDVTYCEAPVGARYAEDPASLERMHGAFAEAARLALPPAESAGLIRDAASRLAG